VFSPLAQKMQPKSKKIANPWLWILWTMQGFTLRGQSKRNWIFPDSNALRSHSMSRRLHHPVFAFRLAENPAWTERIWWERWMIWSSGWNLDKSLNQNDRNGLCRLCESIPLLDWRK
jgi:hypothetical protein